MSGKEIVNVFQLDDAPETMQKLKLVFEGEHDGSPATLCMTESHYCHGTPTFCLFRFKGRINEGLLGHPEFLGSCEFHDGEELDEDVEFVFTNGARVRRIKAGSGQQVTVVCGDSNGSSATPELPANDYKVYFGTNAELFCIMRIGTELLFDERLGYGAENVTRNRAEIPLASTTFVDDVHAVDLLLRIIDMRP